VSNFYVNKLNNLKAQPVHKLSEVGDQWRTSEELYQGANTKYGPFALDIFTDGENAKCAQFYTAENNALTQDWTADLDGRWGWANPPYSRSSYLDGDKRKEPLTGMRNIMKKAFEEREKGAKFVFLIKAATAEVWWPENADHIVFIRGRVGFKVPEWFIPEEGAKAANAGFGAVLAIFNKEHKGEKFSYVHRDYLEDLGSRSIQSMNKAIQQMESSHGTHTHTTNQNN